jgi:hypothetical protein
VQLDHSKRIESVHLIPIARDLAEFDISNFVEATSIYFENGINTIYVLAKGYNIPWAKSAVKAIEEMGKYAKFQD